MSISKLKTHGTKGKAITIKDHYYNKDEYNELSQDQKKELATKRLKRGHKPGHNDSNVKGTGVQQKKATKL